MLARADGLKLPVGLIPISPQSDICFSLGNPTVDHALDYICRRETIEIDTIKVMIDTDETEELPQGPERLQKQRYMIQNSTLVMPAQIHQSAKSFEGCCGNTSFSIASFIKGITWGYKEDQFDIQIDGKKVNDDGKISTGFLVVSNGKYSNKGSILNPFAAMNDGLVDITWNHDPAVTGYFGMNRMLTKA